MFVIFRFAWASIWAFSGPSRLHFLGLQNLGMQIVSVSSLSVSFSLSLSFSLSPSLSLSLSPPSYKQTHSCSPSSQLTSSCFSFPGLLAAALPPLSFSPCFQLIRSCSPSSWLNHGWFLSSRGTRSGSPSCLLIRSWFPFYWLTRSWFPFFFC